MRGERRWLSRVDVHGHRGLPPWFGRGRLVLAKVCALAVQPHRDIASYAQIQAIQRLGGPPRIAFSQVAHKGKASRVAIVGKVDGEVHPSDFSELRKDLLYMLLAGNKGDEATATVSHLPQ